MYTLGFRVGSLVVFLTFALLVGCSRSEFSYRYADYLAIFYAGQYVDLSPTQKKHLRTDIRAFLDEARYLEVPLLIDDIEQIRKMVDQGLTSAELAQVFDNARQTYESIAKRSIPRIAVFLTSLTPEQLDRFEAELEADNEEYFETYVGEPAEVRLDQLAERTIDNYETWVGRLSDLQRSRIIILTHQLPDMAREWHEFKKQRQAGLLELLRRDPEPARAALYLHNWWVNYERPAPMMAARVQGFRVAVGKMMLEVDQGLSARQRDHLVAELDTLVRDLSRISRPAPALEQSPLAFM